MAALAMAPAPASAATVWHVSAGGNAADTNPGTAEKPVRSVSKGVSLAKPGDTVLVSPGTHACSDVLVPDGTPAGPITLRSEGKGRVVFTSEKSSLALGSYNVVDGIEFECSSDHPGGSAISVARKEHVAIRNCRFFAFQVGVSASSAHYVSITNCEMAYSGAYGIHIDGSGGEATGHWHPADGCRDVELRNCYLHDAGWNTPGTEGYGFAANGAVERLAIENCQIDNNSGDGILYEDWGIHTTARYNVIRGSAIAAIWIDNASMSIFDSNYLEANNVAVWLSGEESSNRFLTDFVAIRNNIVVHNDWAPFAAIDPSVYGKVIFLISASTRDTYFDNNTVAFNKCDRVVGIQNNPPQNDYRNIWFRNNIFWQNSGAVAADAGVNLGEFQFVNNLWDKPYKGDARATTGDPLFVAPKAHAPEGYKIQAGSAAKDRGMLLYENPLDFWNGARPHRSRTEKYDIGAAEFGTTGTAHIGLDLATFPFPVSPYKLRFKAKPRR
jgi:hypothetical protein